MMHDHSVLIGQFVEGGRTGIGGHDAGRPHSQMVALELRSE